MAERNMYKGTPDDFATKVIEPNLEKHGLLWCTYRSEEEKVKNAKLYHGKGGVEAHHC